MPKVDPLLDAIIAAPGDDTPRLLWADQAGAERGEFVRIQCALAQPNLPREDRHRLAARERELLLAQTQTWCGLGALGRVTTPRFRRGFVEEVEVALADLAVCAEELLACAPLLRAIHLRNMPGKIKSLDSWPPYYLWQNTEKLLTQAFKAFLPGQIRVLSTEPAAEWFDSDGGNLHAMGDELVAWIAQTPALQSLTSLTVKHGYVTPAIIDRLIRLVHLGELTVDGHHLRAAHVIDLLRSLPGVNRLAIRYGDEPFDPKELLALLNEPAATRLRALDLLGHELSNNDIERVAALPLEHLAFYSSAMSTRGLDALLENQTLRALTLTGALNESQLKKLARARFAKNLRRLELSGMVLEASQLDLLLAFPAMESVCITQRRGERSTAALEAVIPEVVVRWTWGPR